MRYTDRTKNNRTERETITLLAISSESIKRRKEHYNIMCSLTVILRNRELGIKTCLTDDNVWCQKHEKLQSATKTYCRKHIDGFLAEGYDYNKISVSIDLCNSSISNLEYLDAKERRINDTPTWPRYNLAFFDNYNYEEEEQE